MAESSTSSKKAPSVTINRTDSSESGISIKSPRTPRFAEATSVHSPIDPPDASQQPFSPGQQPKSQWLQPQAQPADFGFGYINNNSSRGSQPSVEMPITPASPLKSAMKSPGAPPKSAKSAMLSPTWKEEEYLEKREELTDKEQAKDLKVKTRVRIAKMALRFTNFSCSLIVLSMLSSTFSIFNATKNLPPRNNLPAWAPQTIAWPAILLLCISILSLVMAMAVFWGYYRGGHRRAEKAAAYYSIFAVGFFVFSIVMWGIGAGVLQSTRSNSDGQDIWGWSCKDNTRKDFFQNAVNYDVVCRMQNWSLVCALIEIVVEIITILIYGWVFYRFYSKRRLRQSMAQRDRARSDLYLAQLKSQTQPNTPAPFSPRDGGYNPAFSPRFAGDKNAGVNATIDEVSAAEEGIRYVDATDANRPKAPFKLQTPPKKGTPKAEKGSFSPVSEFGSPLSSTGSTEDGSKAGYMPSPVEMQHLPSTQQQQQPKQQEHAPSAPGETQYEAVPIPGAYSGPAINSPTHPPTTPMPFGVLR